MTVLRIPPERRENRCSAPVRKPSWETMAWRRRAQREEAAGRDPNQCNRPAVYYYYGDFLCEQHAGRKALDEMELQTKWP